MMFPRARFLGAAATAVAATQLVGLAPADAQASSSANTAFASVKQIDAGLLNVGYAETGPPVARRSSCCTAGPTTSTASSMSRRCLASAGYRVIVPYLRGYGTTRFLSNETFRNGQQSVVALDIIALMDALKIEKRDRRRF